MSILMPAAAVASAESKSENAELVDPAAVTETIPSLKSVEFHNILDMRGVVDSLLCREPFENFESYWYSREVCPLTIVIDIELAPPFQLV